MTVMHNTESYSSMVAAEGDNQNGKTHGPQGSCKLYLLKTLDDLAWQSL